MMSERTRLSIFFLFSLLLVGYLFYLDEGNYNFEWMKSAGAWLIYFAYVIVIFFGQAIISEKFIATSPTFSRVFWSILLGPFLGASFSAFLLFCFVHIKNLF